MDKKVWIDPWSHAAYRDLRPTINGGAVNPDFAKWYTDDSVNNCMGCRCCGDAPECTDTVFGSEWPAVVRIVWELGFCNCAETSFNDAGSWLQLLTPGTIDGSAFYCCLIQVPVGTGSGSGPGSSIMWECRANLDCYTDYKWYTGYPCDDTPITGNLTTGRHDLQIVCLVTANGAGITWTIRVDLSIQTPDGLLSFPIQTIGAPGSNINETYGCVQETGPPIEGIECSDSNAAPPPPQEWAGESIVSLDCVGCECSPAFYTIGPMKFGSLGSLVYTSCPNF